MLSPILGFRPLLLPPIGTCGMSSSVQRLSFSQEAGCGITPRLHCSQVRNFSRPDMIAGYSAMGILAQARRAAPLACLRGQRSQNKSKAACLVSDSRLSVEGAALAEGFVSSRFSTLTSLSLDSFASASDGSDDRSPTATNAGRRQSVVPWAFTRYSFPDKSWTDARQTKTG